ncbi:MAG: hypothetical protein C5B59_04630 [Bacteroidetes bacterium]|nr:MAG: hypothetical protein C5B59_04630 [Bacteroidota bacterium]
MNKTIRTILFASLLAPLTQCNNQTQQAEEPKKDTSNVVTRPDPTKEWKIGIQTWTFNKYTLVEALAKVDSAGVKYVEAFPGQKLGEGFGKESFGLNMSAENKEKLKQLLQLKGIHIEAMGVITPSKIDEWKKFFDLAKEFNLSYITAEPLKNQWKQVDSLAGLYGIKVAIHDHPKPNAYWGPDSVLAAVSGHPNIGACADVGHWARNGLNPVDCLKKLSGHIIGVHLKDITTFNDTKAADTVVGKGVIDFPAIFQELKDQNFRGMFSIEHESNWYHSLPDVIETIRFYKEAISKLK